MTEDEELEDDAEVEGECEICGQLTTLHCNRCLFVVCAECVCPNGCDAPQPADEPMTQVVTGGLPVVAELLRDWEKD